MYKNVLRIHARVLSQVTFKMLLQVRKCRAAVRHFLSVGNPFYGDPVRPNMLNIPKYAYTMSSSCAHCT